MMNTHLEKPKLFIGSSSEGLGVAEAVFAAVGHSTQATLWKHGVFLPGKHPLEILEEQLGQHDFAILVASPDDLIMKRGSIASVTRDNILVEFGLFAGALGRRHVFIIAPHEPKLDLPSDLLGVIVAHYDAARAGNSLSERRAAVEIGCQDILQAIKKEWTETLDHRHQEALQIANSEKGQAVRRLYAISSSLRDTILAVQRDALGALSDQRAFEEAKRRAVNEVSQVVNGLDADAKTIGVSDQLRALTLATSHALQELPFPQELAPAREDGRKKAVDLGMRALDTFLAGGDPLRDLSRAAEEEVGGRIEGLRQRYAEWWSKHSPVLHQATLDLQDALFVSLSQLSLQKRDIGN